MLDWLFAPKAQPSMVGMVGQQKPSLFDVMTQLNRKGHEWDKDQRDPWRPTDSDREELWRQSVRTMQSAQAAPTERNFIAAMQQKQLAEASKARQLAAMVANMPQGTGAISNQAQTRPNAIADMLFSGLSSSMGMPKRLANDYAGYGKTAADMTLPGTLDQLDRGDLEGVAMGMAAGPAKGIRAFHGSPHSFDKFSLDRAGTTTDGGQLGRGAYLSTDPRVPEGSAHKYEVDVSLSNPLNLSMPDFRTDKSGLVRTTLGLPDNANPAAISEELADRGHDGVVLDYSPTGYKEQEIMVLDPSLISIVKKYGIPAALGAGLITEEMARQMQEQGLGQI